MGLNNKVIKILRNRIWNFLPVVVFIIVVSTSCKKSTGINIFSLEQDREFGETMDSVIRSDPEEFPVLDKNTNPEPYQFMNEMMNEILQSDDFVHKEDFTYQITIIDKNIMNAFAVPGGKIYFYTGLMKFLDNSANLAGVMAHEMAHVDQRHSTEQLTKVYGISFLLDILVGDDKSQMEKIAIDLATGLGALQFSRKHEYEADEYSVQFLADTKYHPKGITGFFEKLMDEEATGGTVEFLSTHPSDEKRMAEINQLWEDIGMPSGEYFEDEYNEFKSTLP